MKMASRIASPVWWVKIMSQSIKKAIENGKEKRAEEKKKTKKKQNDSTSLFLYNYIFYATKFY